MIRSFKLEWLKIRHYRVFWVLLGMYLLALVIICSLGVFFFEWLRSKGVDFDGIDPTIIPIYDFPDIWQNTTYLASFLKILLSFIVIISVSNDQAYNTLRQNVVDGISKREFVISKLMLIIFLASVSTATLFIAGFVNGLIYSHVTDSYYIFKELEFIAAYFYDIVVFCSLAFLLTILIKKAGFVIVALALYTLIFEPIATVVLENAPYFVAGGIWPRITPFFPINTLNDLIPVPFEKYIFREIKDYVPLHAILISTAWLMIYISGIYYLLVKRDLK